MMPSGYNPFRRPARNNRKKTKGRPQNLQQYNGFTGSVHQQQKVEAFKRYKSLFHKEELAVAKLSEKGRTWQSRKKLKNLVETHLRPLIKMYEEVLGI